MGFRVLCAGLRAKAEARRKAEEEAKAYPGSLNRLKDVLAERGFSDEANKKILDVYDLVSENYDATYGYRKAPKSEYLEKLIDAVSRINTINVYTTGSPEAVQNNISYGTPAQFDHADNSLEFLSDYDGVDLNIVLAHELKHVMDGPMNSTITSVHSSAIKAFREGSASRGEDQAQDYVHSRIYSIYVDVEKNITINKEFTTTDMSYQMYENIADEHFECLLGEDRFDAIKRQSGDFVFNLRNALVSEFGKDVGENVLKNYFLAARNMDQERLYSSGNEAKQLNNLTNELNYFQDLSTASNQQELIDKLDAKLATYHTDIDVFETNLEGLRTKPEYANVDVTKYIRQYEEYIATATKYVKLTEGFKSIPYEQLTEYARFIVSLDTAEIQNLNDKLSGINTVTNSIIGFEESCNKALEQKIQSAKTKDEVDELKALLAYYHKSVRVNVTFFATEQNVTEESFLRLPAELVEKEKELGLDQEISDTSTEAETNHQNINIKDFEKYFGR